jgi:hypothetical protein
MHRYEYKLAVWSAWHIGLRGKLLGVLSLLSTT